MGSGESMVERHTCEVSPLQERTTMRELLLTILRIIYTWVKSSPYLSGIYYDVTNIEYFSHLHIQETMLADKARVDAYHNAILKYVNEDDVVIDLGAGTGILSFFASLKRPKQIYAIEHSKKMVTAAQVTADCNQITNITFLNMNSKNLILEEKVDVILQEQMGPFLFDENMVENVVDLRDRLLKKGGKILPSTFELFIEPVTIVDERRVPFIWEQKIYNVNFECLGDLKEEVSGGHYGYRFIARDAIECFLCDPERVLFVNLEMITADDIPRKIHYIRRIDRNGRVDGFCLYFNVVFDEEIGFSTSPGGSGTHWGHVLLRVESNECRKGDWIEFNMTVSDVTDKNTYRWSYRKLTTDELGERSGESELATVKVV